ncbi:MAG: AAC(3) family N-acetyltransferase [Vulcanimicrobiota bacterium]
MDTNETKIKITSAEVHQAFQSVLAPGDDVLIHAALGNLGHFEDGIEALIHSLCQSVTAAGTVVMMADTRSFAKTGTFSLDQPSETGLITERFRQMEGVSRSCVPMVSFLAWGARREEYTQSYHSHLDGTATITRLLENDGKIMLLGIGYEKCTLYHLAEERHNVPYNFYKEFKGVLRREGQPDEPISQRYYVREDMSVKKNPAVAGHMLEARGLAQVVPLGNEYVRVFRARDFDRCCMEALEKDPKAFLA